MTPERPPAPAFARRYPGIATAVVRAARRWRSPLLCRYAPRTLLELPEHQVTRAAEPAIDAHTHLGRWLSPNGEWMERDVGRLLADMDETNVESVINLDGRWGRELEENLDRYDRAHPGRFHTFCHVDWRLLEERGGPDRLATSLRRSLDAGARGLKVWKDLGLSVQARGRRILPGDSLLEPLWEQAAAAGVPVLIHVADPLAFFLPPDRFNERLEEIRRYPRGGRHPGGAPAFHGLIDSFEHAVSSHCGTQFVGAHACHPENLARVAAMLDRYPNFSIDISAAASELGRQPRSARGLIMGHPDQILFGTDVFPWRTAARQVYFRLLETDDEAFAYSDEAVPPCGRWQIYGLDLPAAVLRKVYRDNAARLLGLDAGEGAVADAAGVGVRPR